MSTLTNDSMASIRNRVRYIAPLTLSILSLFVAPSHAQRPAAKIPPFPSPFAIIKNTKEFNAVQFGPGNTFSIQQVPPEFQMNEFAISSDGSFLAVVWGSGKIDLWDLPRKKHVANFKSVGVPGVIEFGPNQNQLLTVAGGNFAILDLPKGKKLRGFSVPLGKFNYAIQQVVLDPGGKWLAYADEESSKVLDLSVGAPRTLADLGNANTVSLSFDGTELWTANRKELTAYRTSNWDVIGHWPLKSPPVANAPVRLKAGVTKDGQTIVAVPSGHGLVIYRKPAMEGEFATDKSTTMIAFSSPSKMYLTLGLGFDFINSSGTVSCSRSILGLSDYDVSQDGQWLAIRQTNAVSVWRMDDLLRDCEAGR